MAYKLLIVDDLIADRVALHKMIMGFGDLNLELIGTCQSGTEAIEWIQTYRPDVVVSDLEMPVMDGIQLAKTVKLLYPEIKFIYCSLYHNFDYARKALYLDNYGYVLKPVEKEELHQAILGALQSIRMERQHNEEYWNLVEELERNKPLMINSFIKDLLYGMCTSAMEIMNLVGFYELDISQGPYRLVLAEIDDFEVLTESMTMEQKQVTSLRVFSTLRETADAGKTVCCQLDESHFGILIAESDEESIQFVCNSIFREFKKSDISLTLAASDEVAQIGAVRELFEQCGYALRFKYSVGKGAVLHYSDFQDAKSTPQIDLNQLQNDVRYFLNAYEPENMKAFVEALFQKTAEVLDPSYGKKLCYDITVCVQTVLMENNTAFEEIFGADFIVWEKLIRIETIWEARNWMVNLMNFSAQYLEKRSQEKSGVLIETVRKLIRESDLKTVSVSGIASSLYYSPDYLNYVFKQSCKETILEYIARCKIERAKEMLLDPSLKLYQIADALGYAHTAYFSNLFKKHTGITPKDYRERMGFPLKKADKGEETE